MKHIIWSYRPVCAVKKLMRREINRRTGRVASPENDRGHKTRIITEALLAFFEAQQAKWAA